VISQKDKEKLLASCDRNIAAVDLPQVPPDRLGPDELYQSAAALLKQWQGSAVLCREERPAIYLHEQQYRWAGRSHIRRGIICGVRATELGGDVIPHERTYPGPMADRLRLMELTGMHLSAILGFYAPPGRLGDLLAGSMSGPPAAHAELDGVAERMWAVTDGPVINEIAAALRDVPVFIADGHHRYTTALSYRNSLRDAGRIDDDHEANFVMFSLVAASDPGLLIMPAHRILRGLGADFCLDELVRVAPEFTWRRADAAEVDFDDVDGFLRRQGLGTMALLAGHPPRIWIAAQAAPEAMRRAAPDQSESWRALDVAVVQKLIIDKALKPWHTDKLFIDYTPDVREVLGACRNGRGQLGICLQATPLDAVETIARSGSVMPHKSTYFYPKLTTGMVLKPLWNA